MKICTWVCVFSVYCILTGIYHEQLIKFAWKQIFPRKICKSFKFDVINVFIFYPNVQSSFHFYNAWNIFQAYMGSLEHPLMSSHLESIYTIIFPDPITFTGKRMPYFNKADLSYPQTPCVHYFPTELCFTCN